MPEAKTKEWLWKRWREEAGGRQDTWSAGGRRGRVRGEEEAAGNQRHESLGLRQEVARVWTMAGTEPEVMSSWEWTTDEVRLSV